jgi:hypothetical protein
MSTAWLTCRFCGLRFNHEFTPGVSLTAVRRTWGRSFRCPRCQKFQTFDLRTLGPVPGIPTFTDPLGRNLVIFVTVLVAGVLGITEIPTILQGKTIPWIATIVVPVTAIACVLALAAYGLYKSELRRVPSA